jgi:hypothetical protein
MPRTPLLLLALMLSVNGCINDSETRDTDVEDADGGTGGAGGAEGEGGGGADGAGGEGAGGEGAGGDGAGGEGAGGEGAGGEGAGGGKEPSCEADGDCEDGEICGDDGLCIDAGECPGGCNQLQACLNGECRDRCFGPGTCFRGGFCMDGVCNPPECEADADCDGDLLCRDDRCVEPSPCEVIEDCGDDERCVEGNCEPLAACGGDRNCGPAEICDGGLCRPRAECNAENDCGDDEDCVGGRCVPFVCRGDADCADGEICTAGACEETPEAEIATIVVVAGPHAVFVGQQFAYHAVGIDLRGDIVATGGFEWQAEGEDTGDFEGDVLTAGPEAGAIAVTAALGDVVSEPYPVIVHMPEPAPEETPVSVLVTDAETGAAIEGAMVLAGDAEATTDEAGVALFEAEPENGTYTVFSEGHDYLTVVGLAGDALHLTLWPRTEDARVAGFTGEISFDDVLTEGAVDLGLAGAAIGGELTRLNLGVLIGDLFNAEVNTGFGNFALPLPGGLILAATVPVIGNLQVKDTYFARTQPGLQLAWSFAGRLDFGTVAGLLMGGGGFDVGRVLTTVLPFFDSFQHDLRVAPELVALPQRPDEDDLDGDGDLEELVPDYDRFPVLDMEPAQSQDLRIQVDVAGLPGEDAVVLLFAGAELDGVGFVPLGVSAADEPGVIPMRLAAPYAGLEGGTRTLLAIGAEFGGDGGALPENIAVRMLRFGPNLPPDATIGDTWVGAPTVEWDPAMRSLGGMSADGADVHRATLSNGAGRWHVFFAPGDVNLGTRLPFPPEGMADLAGGAGVELDALDLGNRRFGEFGLQGTGSLLELDRIAEGFTRAVAE